MKVPRLLFWLSPMMLEHADDLYFAPENARRPRATEVSVVMPHLLALVAVGLIIGLSCLGCLS